jgi:hypothetical protein
MAMQTRDCTAEDIARALKGHRTGRGWTAPCPSHDDRTPSLSIVQADDRVLVHCHAGCPQLTVIEALKSRGLWQSAETQSTPRPLLQRLPTLAADVKVRVATAQRLWSETVPLDGTLGERYFVEHRNLDVSRLELDHALRWHKETRAVIGLMTDPRSGDPVGIHRTFLQPDGTKLERKMLGRQGVVRLSPDDSVTMGLGITEGVEDGLAVLLSGWAPVWAATGAGAIASFPVLAGIEALTIFADGDGPGTQAADACAIKWRSAGLQARISHPRGVMHV